MYSPFPSAERDLRRYPPHVLDRDAYEYRRRPNPSATAALRDYPTPDPFETLDGFRRFHHEDIADLSNDDLARERFRARVRWAFEPPTETVNYRWLLQRMARLDAEAARRR